jgi:trimethylamine:corrinoid methyltransferase-like protein
MIPSLRADVLTDKEVQTIHSSAVRILSETGILVQNETLLNLLAESGATIDKENQRARFSEKYIEDFLKGSSVEFDDVDGLEVSCDLPSGNRKIYSNGVECVAGTYPQNFLAFDGEFHPHTVETVIKMTRLGDYLGNFDRLGVMGVPCDVNATLSPLHMRLLAWRHAEKTISGCGETHNPALIPYIIEMGEIMADHKKKSLRRYIFTEVEMISPLRFAEEETKLFVEMWQRGYLCSIGFMHSAGGSAPTTLASVVSLSIAESLFVNFLYRLCYGLKKVYIRCNSSVMDMRRGWFPFGRPERGLVTMAAGQMARYYDAAFFGSAIYNDAKDLGIEGGLHASFNCVPAIMAGTLGLECFGVLSGTEASSPLQLVIDNEFCGALKHYARGFAVNEDTLATELINEVGPGGVFTDQMHTVEHFRTEHWQPTIFARESLNAWLAGDHKTAVERARDICDQVFNDYHPRGMSEDVEQQMKDIIKRAEKDLLN